MSQSLRHFLYFLPGLTAPGQRPAELGLVQRLGGFRHALVNGRLADQTDLGRGVLLAASTIPAAELQFRPEWQWRPIRDEADEILYWLGWDGDNPPGPDDLQRPAPIAGEMLALRDKNEWLIPIARLAPDELSQPCDTCLPRVHCLDADGHHAMKVEPEYLDLWDAAGEAFSDLLQSVQAAAGESVYAGMAYNRIVQIVASAVGCNYRIGQPELLALELCGETHLANVLQILCDWKQWEQLMAADGKKKAAAPDSSNSTSPE